MFNNDRIAHWLLGCVVAWVIWGAAFGAVAHTVLGIALTPLVVFFAAQCALQAAVTPWFFAARKTAAKPRGDKYKRTMAIIVWGTLASEIFAYAFLGGDFSDHTAAVIFLGVPVVFGVLASIVAYSLRARLRTSTK